MLSNLVLIAFLLSIAVSLGVLCFYFTRIVYELLQLAKYYLHMLV
jgi:hypothetical protein